MRALRYGIEAAAGQLSVSIKTQKLVSRNVAAEMVACNPGARGDGLMVQMLLDNVPST